MWVKFFKRTCMDLMKQFTQFLVDNKIFPQTCISQVHFFVYAIYVIWHHCSCAILKYKCKIIILHLSLLEYKVNNGRISNNSFISCVWAPCNQHHISHLKNTEKIYHKSSMFHRLKCVTVSKSFVFLFPIMKRFVTSLAQVNIAQFASISCFISFFHI